MANPNDDSISGGDGTGNTGTSVKTVPESDLIAVKKAHESELAEKVTEITDLTKEVASERAAKEAAETLSSEIPTLREQLTTITSERDASKAVETAAVAKQTEMTAADLTRRRDFLKTTFNLEDAKVKDLDESQVSALESTLPGVSKAAAVPNPTNLDLQNNNGSGTNTKLSPREKISAGLASQE